ncbi:MAG TPA: DUF1810 domain-containing protein, partial [Chitinophagaceae bacterium]|nr:DUF1810 domain-containing protein [Chitinophagaceae bacterium]
MNNTLDKFVQAQEKDYEKALAEIKGGRKRSHWIWYIFPQLKGLGRSTTAHFYGLENLQEAQAYFNHKVLGPRLVLIAQALLSLPGDNASEIMGSPDDMKLRSSMTLFAALADTDPVFDK